MALISNIVRGSSSNRLALLVHGYGADERDLGGLLTYLDPDGSLAVVLPRGQFPVPGTAGFAWYGMFQEDQGEGSYGEALAELDDLLSEQADALELPRGESIVAGFSQGGGLALGLALQRSDRPRPKAALAMSPAIDTAAFDLDEENAPPVLVQHGTNDPLIPVQRSRDLARQLRELGVPTVYREYPMAHQVALESLQDAREWLALVVRRRAPRRAGARRSDRARAVGHDRALGRRGAAERAAGDRRLLGAVVRAVPAGVADRRDDRRDAEGLLQGREGQHRRGAAARAGVRRAEHPDDRARAQRPPRARGRWARSPAPSSKPSSGCSSSRNPIRTGVTEARMVATSRRFEGRVYGRAAPAKSER